jgi:hypothetical protein
MQQDAIKAIIKQTIDMHIHVGPDIMPRKYTTEDLTNAERDTYSGMCIKSHGLPPLSHNFEGPNIVPSITLNNFVGGLNPEAIYSLSKTTDKRIVVWLPTIHAQHHIDNRDDKYEVAKHWVGKEDVDSRRLAEVDGIELLDKDGNLTESCMGVISAVEDVDGILATGHISPEEGKMVAIEATSRDVPCIITHALERYLDYPIEIQKELVESGAIIEHCMEVVRHHPDDNHVSNRVKAIKSVGAENCLLSSDAGQVFNDKPSTCLEEFIELLYEEGLTLEDIETMCIGTPKELLDK